MSANEQCLSELHRTTSSEGEVTERIKLVCRKPKGHHGPCTGMARTGPVNWRLDATAPWTAAE